MSDIIIKAKSIKRELFIFLGVLLFSCGLNVYSIIHYKTQWSELISELHVILLMSIFFYLVIALFRVVIGLVAKAFAKKATN